MITEIINPIQDTIQRTAFYPNAHREMDAVAGTPRN